MKLKYYLRGLGTGILFATIIMFIAYSYRDSNNKEKETGSEKVAEQESEFFSSTKPTTSEEKSTKDDSATSESTTPKESENNIDESIKEETFDTETKESSEEETTEEKTIEETTIEIETTTEAETTANVVVDDTMTTVEFTIYSGYTSHDVANVLASAGVIDNAAEFDVFLAQNGYDYRIATGVYTVTVGESFESIAQKITR